MATLSETVSKSVKTVCSNTTVQQGSIFSMVKLSTFLLCYRAESIATVL